MAHNVKALFCESKKLSLKCQCAQIIGSSNMYYEHYLNSYLTAFVRLHSRPKPNEIRYFDDWSDSGW
ncbi:unnamed protein product [Rotaria sp. Silwood2]|nr:unnamed protein product [Rotaria sp. Silwood2]